MILSCVTLALLGQIEIQIDLMVVYAKSLKKELVDLYLIGLGLLGTEIGLPTILNMNVLI